MDDNALLRYSRQILLPEIGIEGQQKIQASQVLVIGLGGLGSPVAMYLAAAGVGRLILVDDDDVDLSNLQRQIVHTTDTIGQRKTSSAQQHLRRLNPDCTFETYNKRLTEAELKPIIQSIDAVVDCSDNFHTRFLLNRVCHAMQTPLISGAAIRWEGQLSVFTYQPNTACYRCLYDDAGEEALNCSENGVIAPLVGVIGSMQALETIKLLSGVGEVAQSRLILLDGLQHTWRTIQLKPDPTCPVCSLKS